MGVKGVEPFRLPENPPQAVMLVKIVWNQSA